MSPNVLHWSVVADQDLAAVAYLISCNSTTGIRDC
jgi:hypothetical protein